MLLMLLATGSAATSAEAQPTAPLVLGVDRWQVYGTAFARKREDAVPGEVVVAIEPRTQRAEPWSSGASMNIPGAIAAGERVTAVIWARAERPSRVTLSLQGGEPHFARFAAAEVTLSPTWRQLSVTGTAAAPLAAGSQTLTLLLGRVDAEVTLGPVAFLRGGDDPAGTTRAFAGFRPARVALDVSIASEPGVTLAGTLYLPMAKGAGPFPLAIAIQGKGPNGRGGFDEIIKRLVSDGIAALEYDKRGIGRSTGSYKEDIRQLTKDAAAAVAAMRGRSDIDGSRIALIGHSQGGVIAPAVAAADPAIAAVVVLAGSIGDGLPYLRGALTSQMIMAGTPPAAVPPPVEAAVALLQARIDGKDPAAIARLRAAVVERFEGAGLPRAQAEGALAMIDTEEAWAVDELRSASDLESLRAPVLALFADKDPLVVAADEAPAARAALAGNPSARVEVLEGLSHWFQEGARTGGAEEVPELGPNLGSPRLVSMVGDWLRHALGADAVTAPSVAIP